MAIFKKKIKQEPKKEVTQSASTKKNATNAYQSTPRRALRQPLITEKTFMLSQKGQYVFLTDPRISKSEARKEIEKMYKVSVVSIRTLQEKKSSGSFRGIAGGIKKQKKVIVNLKKGQSIDITGNR